MERLSIDEVIEHCKRFISRYNKEVVEKVKDIRHCSVVGYWEHKQVKEWLEELKAYRQAEEQGLLLRLPCKVGDTLYVISRNEVIPVTVTWFIYNQYGIGICAKNEEHWGYGEITLYQNRKCVEWYKTKEEAEKKLAEMKGE